MKLFEIENYRLLIKQTDYYLKQEKTGIPVFSLRCISVLSMKYFKQVKNILFKKLL